MFAPVCFCLFAQHKHVGVFPPLRGETPPGLLLAWKRSELEES